MDRRPLIVLDTHAWLWWTSDDPKLGPDARRAIANARRILVPSICLWELNRLASCGRVRFDRPMDVWMRDALALPRVELAPITPELIERARMMASCDVADALIYATALLHRAPLITSDDRIGRGDSEVPCIW